MQIRVPGIHNFKYHVPNPLGFTLSHEIKKIHKIHIEQTLICGEILRDILSIAIDDFRCMSYVWLCCVNNKTVETSLDFYFWYMVHVEFIVLSWFNVQILGMKYVVVSSSMVEMK